MANEKRLISVEKTVKELENEIYWTESTKAAIRAFLRTVPAVDAVEVVHGRWVLREKAGADYWCCTACDRRISEYWAEPKYNYCPNCGAKMDG